MLSHKIKTMKCEQFGPENKFFGYKEQKGHQIHKPTTRWEEFKTTKTDRLFQTLSFDQICLKMGLK